MLKKIEKRVVGISGPVYNEIGTAFWGSKIRKYKRMLRLEYGEKNDISCGL